MKYKVVDSLSALHLTQVVNDEIKLGWKPIGGVSITGEFHGTLVYAQALGTHDNRLKVPVERKFAID